MIDIGKWKLGGVLAFNLVLWAVSMMLFAAEVGNLRDDLTARTVDRITRSEFNEILREHAERPHVGVTPECRTDDHR